MPLTQAPLYILASEQINLQRPMMLSEVVKSLWQMGMIPRLLVLNLLQERFLRQPEVYNIEQTAKGLIDAVEFVFPHIETSEWNVFGITRDRYMATELLESEFGQFKDKLNPVYYAGGMVACIPDSQAVLVKHNFSQTTAQQMKRDLEYLKYTYRSGEREFHFHAPDEFKDDQHYTEFLFDTTMLGGNFDFRAPEEVE